MHTHRQWGAQCITPVAHSVHRRNQGSVRTAARTKTGQPGVPRMMGAQWCFGAHWAAIGLNYAGTRVQRLDRGGERVSDGGDTPHAGDVRQRGLVVVRNRDTSSANACCTSALAMQAAVPCHHVRVQ